MAGLSVLVDDQLCYSFPNSSDIAALDGLEKKIDFTCTTSLIGRVVRLQKHGEDRDGQFYFINICEVQVWGCRDGLYGAECVEQCGQCADNDTCSAVSGHCPNGCQPGWQADNCKQMCAAGKYGNNCSSSCGHCNPGDVCHHNNGTCPRGCAAGFDPADPLCERSCPDGTYGPVCQTDCGNCLNSVTCNAMTGVCPGRCDPGWTNQYCTGVCPSGTFGDDCSMKCINCSQNRCNNVDGECLEGCKPGYQLTPQNHFCNEFCQNGGYGDNCSEPCGQCSGGDQCDPFTGTCAACEPQFKPPFCKVCSGKMYGAQCEQPCSAQCGGDGSCDRKNGMCQTGCVSGYLLGSGFCDQNCRNGAFGPGCAKKCGNCAESRCNHRNGTCEVGCIDGYVGDICSELSESTPSLAGPVAGAVFGGLCVIALSILVGLLIRRSRKRSSSETASPHQASTDQSFGPGAPVGLNGQVATQEEAGSAGATEAEESHIYDGLQTPDDSDRDPYATPVFEGKQDKGRNSHTYQNSAFYASDTGKDYYNL